MSSGVLENVILIRNRHTMFGNTTLNLIKHDEISPLYWPIVGTNFDLYLSKKERVPNN